MKSLGSIAILLSVVMAMMPARAHADAVPVSLAAPSMYGPLALNPYSLPAGPLGTLYVSGVASGFALWQDHPAAGDHSSQFDLDNGQLIVQKADGPLQFYIQAGGYTLPALGVNYLRMDKATDELFGPVPIAFVKIAPNDHFSIQAGKLYTLIGTENTFSFQNANVEHGLLWNQTNDLNRGVQVNYSDGAFSGSFAVSDGFYSGRADWLSGLATYTFDANHSLTLIASGNISRNALSNFATPLAQDNSQIYDLNYSYTTGAWNLSPTLQYTHVPQALSVGLAAPASTYGAGLTTKYSFNSQWSMAARAEVIDTTGRTNVAYGAGSNAMSLTVTPTWQQDIFFARPELSYVRVTDTASGAAFGPHGNQMSQVRLLIETGILF